jgi:hypothetical protein
MSTNLSRRLGSAIGAIRDDRPRQALYAVTDEIERMRREAPDSQTEITADRLERVVAEALGIES